MKKQTPVWFLVAALLLLSVSEIWAEEKSPTLAKFKDIHMEFAFPPSSRPDQPGKITYTLLEPARVRIRVVAEGTRELYLRTPVDWQVRDAGTHTETWDCKDNSGYLLKRGDVIIQTVGEPMSTYKPGTMPLKDVSPEEIIHGHKYGHIHNRHHTWACREVLLKILSPKEGEKLSGKVVIKAEVDKERRGYGDKYGYGVRCYLNRKLVNEQFYKPESDGKFSYPLDTSAFLDGEYMLNLGMCDHNDHGTSAGVKVTIDNSGLKPRP